MITGKRRKTGGFIFYIYKRIIDMKISLKLALSYLIGAAACMLILSMFYYINTKNYIDTQTKVLLGQSLHQAKDNIDDRVNLYNMLADSVYMNTKFQDLLFGDYKTPSEQLDMQTEILSYLGSLKSTYKDISGITLVVENPKVPAHGSLIANEGSVSGESWYRKAASANTGTLWVDGNSYKSPGMLLQTRRLDHMIYDSYLGVLRLELNKDSFFRALKEVGKKDQGWFDIVDSGNHFIYSGLSQEKPGFRLAFLSQYQKKLFSVHSSTATISVNNNKYMTMQDTIQYVGWKILYTVPMSSFADALKRLQLAAFGFLLLSALLFIGISWFLSSNFTKKIRELSHSMEKIQTGQFDVYIHYPGNDEIGHLINGFNIMAGKLKELVEEVYTMKVLEKESELKALQAQINPHFLYNTLASISMLGMRTGGEDITRMSNSLAKFYKISLSNGNNIIRVRDEIEHVRAYMDIQNIRFKNKIKMDYEVEEGILNNKSLKLMLQPFVENAIGHGLWNDKKSITIRILVTRENDGITWKVIDDGVGINRRRLESILYSGEEQEHGYGIVNVDQRIKLFFGDKYGIGIFSLAGIGTVVTINTPLID